jgi:peroxiredoxin
MRRLLLGLSVIVSALASACGGGQHDSATAGGGASPLSIRMTMPAVDGGMIDLARYRGRVVVLHLFDTDTASAALDVEELSALTARRPEQAIVIGICLDREGTTMARAWRRALGVRYLVALGDEQLRQGRSPLGRFRVVPSTFVLDRAGVLVRRIERPLQRGEIDAVVADLLDAE